MRILLRDLRIEQSWSIVNATDQKRIVTSQQSTKFFCLYDVVDKVWWANESSSGVCSLDWFHWRWCWLSPWGIAGRAEWFFFQAVPNHLQPRVCEVCKKCQEKRDGRKASCVLQKQKAYSNYRTGIEQRQATKAAGAMFLPSHQCALLRLLCSRFCKHWKHCHKANAGHK